MQMSMYIKTQVGRVLSLHIVANLTLNEVNLFNSSSVINLIFFLKFFTSLGSNVSLTCKRINHYIIGNLKQNYIKVN
jgi:hypothetical protein